MEIAPERTAVRVAVALPDVAEDVRTDDLTVSLTPWSTIVWNDPVNLMSYVAYVFRSYFGYSDAKAQRLMLQVHHDGRAIVATGGREEMERHVEAMHGYGLWATLEKADA
jgi:ATP-dependent Clp protease adaptor protein ClpS